MYDTQTENNVDDFEKKSHQKYILKISAPHYRINL